MDIYRSYLSSPLHGLPTLIRRLQRRHNSTIKLVLELIQVEIHLPLIRKKHAIHAPLRRIKIVDPGLLLHEIQVILQRTVIVLENGGEGLFAEGLVDGEFDEEDAEVEDELLGGHGWRRLAEGRGRGCGGGEACWLGERG